MSGTGSIPAPEPETLNGIQRIREASASVRSGCEVFLGLFFFLVLVMFLYLVCKLAVFYYEGAFVAAVEAFPDGRAEEDEAIDVWGAAFGAELYFS